MRLIDVHYLDTPKVIGCWELDGILVDPGPTVSVGTVLEALGGESPRALLLTHIHLDHAGSAGTLARRFGGLPVYVHEIGARHLRDPSRLLASASRLYGDAMERLWGAVEPVPEESLRPLAGGEEVLGFRVAYTPGHASHHVSYLHLDSGVAFVGDNAAVRIPPSEYVLPPVPPPDIDLELWERTLETIASWSPAALALTHFGQVTEPGAHLALVRERLWALADRARELDAAEFEAWLTDEIEREGGSGAEAMLKAVSPAQQYAGLDRYWAKRAEAG